MIRFQIQQGDSTTTTEWQEEPVTFRQGGLPTAVVAISELRQQYPDAVISIERTTVIPKPERNQARFKIVLPNNETRYSKVVDEGETDTLLAQLQQKFPNAKEISRG